MTLCPAVGAASSIGFKTPNSGSWCGERSPNQSKFPRIHGNSAPAAWWKDGNLFEKEAKIVFAVPWLGVCSCCGPWGFCGGKETFTSLGVWLLQRLSVLWRVHWEDQLYDSWGTAETPCSQDKVVTGSAALKKSNWERSAAFRLFSLLSKCTFILLTLPLWCSYFSKHSRKPLNNIELGAW